LLAVLQFADLLFYCHLHVAKCLNEIRLTGKSKKKDIIKIEGLETYKRNRKTGGWLLDRFQEKAELYTADFNRVFHGALNKREHYTCRLKNFEEREATNSDNHSAVILTVLLR
jgi:hypothetical protein